MTIVMSEPHADFVDTYPSRPAPLYAAHAASEFHDDRLAEEVRRTRRTLRALDVASAVIVGIAVLGAVLLVLHVVARFA